MIRRDRRALTEAAYIVVQDAMWIRREFAAKGKWRKAEAKALYERLLRIARDLCRIHQRRRAA